LFLGHLFTSLETPLGKPTKGFALDIPSTGDHVSPWLVGQSLFGALCAPRWEPRHLPIGASKWVTGGRWRILRPVGAGGATEVASGRQGDSREDFWRGIVGLPSQVVLMSDAQKKGF
jgi:hypothetical protein